MYRNNSMSIISIMRSTFLMYFLLLAFVYAFMVLSFPVLADYDLERQRIESVQQTCEQIVKARSLASSMSTNLTNSSSGGRKGDLAWVDCLKLYEDAEMRICRLVELKYDVLDAVTWLSGVMTAHSTCMEGLGRSNELIRSSVFWKTVSKALELHAVSKHELLGDNKLKTKRNASSITYGLLQAWNPTIAKPDMVVAQDGSGSYKTINEALTALKRWNRDGNKRIVIYVKSGVYHEYVEIDSNMRKLFFVGDGIDKTVVTGNRNVPDGYTTFGSATFGVLGDEFWARDMTFENIAGPRKHQAVALRVNADRSVFYQCSFKGYQDTLFAVSQRQFYRRCQVYGTVDFIFGNAAVVLQDCDIYVRRPMAHQGNMITAQGRDNPNQNTGISVHASRIRPAQDFQSVKNSFRTYLGRPWKKYSRTVFIKSDMDGMVSKEGWSRWDGDFALDTLYYAEYMNTGEGARTDNRVRWPGFHMITNANDASLFTVERFIDGKSWIPEIGIPFWSGL